MSQQKLLNAIDLQKQYGNSGFQLLPLSFSLYENEITGLVGENGNGKTTLLSMLALDLAPSGGQVEYLFNPRGKVDELKMQVGYISQSLKTWTGTVYENLHFNAAINGIFGEENEQFVDQLIKDLGLWKYRLLQWSELSGGYKMRFELAKVLAGKPRLLILDEPLANLDIKAQSSFLSDLKVFQQKADYPLSIIVSSQHLYKIEEVSDQLIFLQKGKCVYQGSIADMNQEHGQLIYEIVVTHSHDALEGILGVDGILKHSKSGNTYIIYCDQDFGPEKFLLHILHHNIPLHAYRNISNSSRHFFE
ncbi:ATP-binding cassette domain-containing protein [bacterium]|nr:ATP-binding cassette domain-containing protein [bacterium]